MTKRFYTITALLLLPFLFFHSTTQAQSGAAKAKEILNKLANKYKAYNTFKSDFKYTLVSKADDINETQKGSLYMKKEKFKVDMTDQIVYCDSKSIWIYLKDANEVTINKYDSKEIGFSPNEMFTMYEKGFLYNYTGDEVVNTKSCNVVELTPTNKANNYFKVKLFVDKAAGTLARSIIYEKNGAVHTYDLTVQTPNVKVDDAFFLFDKTKFPKVSVVDTRPKGK